MTPDTEQKEPAAQECTEKAIIELLGSVVVSVQPKPDLDTAVLLRMILLELKALKGGLAEPEYPRIP